MITKTSMNIRCIQWGIVGAAFLALYFPFIRTMVSDWGQNDNYSHGYLIPFIVGYMIYSLRGELGDTETKPAAWGLILIVLGLCQLLVAKIGTEFFLQRTSLIVVLFGLSLFFWGTRITAKIAIPLIYLIFMVPLPAIIWNRIAFPMQLFASALTEQVLHMLGFAIFREGNVLHLPETTLEVVDACSGLRSLMSMFALSGAFAFFSGLSTIRKLILFLSAAPIAVFFNIVRLTATAIMARWMGAGAAQGFLHEFSGMLVFVFGLLMLYLVYIMLARVGPAAKNSNEPN